MRGVSGVLIAWLIAVAASLALARVHPFGDAGLYTKGARRASVMGHSAPPEVQSILNAKCADCHSMQTSAPIYGRFAPVSWLMERDIVEGRKHMDLSKWDSYSADQQQAFKAKMVQLTKTREMPLIQYRLIHWNANISDADVKALMQWTRADIGAESGAAGAASGAGDALRGKTVFEKRCTGCHAMDQDREGPRLRGVYGRKAGEVAGFGYSSGLKAAQVVWDESSLERWLADPDVMVPNNNMEFHVAKPDERRDLIAFLKGSK